MSWKNLAIIAITTWIHLSTTEGTQTTATTGPFFDPKRKEVSVEVIIAYCMMGGGLLVILACILLPVILCFFFRTTVLHLDILTIFQPNFDKDFEKLLTFGPVGSRASKQGIPVTGSPSDTCVSNTQIEYFGKWKQGSSFPERYKVPAKPAEFQTDMECVFVPEKGSSPQLFLLENLATARKTKAGVAAAGHHINKALEDYVQLKEYPVGDPLLLLAPLNLSELELSENVSFSVISQQPLTPSREITTMDKPTTGTEDYWEESLNLVGSQASPNRISPTTPPKSPTRTSPRTSQNKISPRKSSPKSQRSPNRVSPRPKSAGTPKRVSPKTRSSTSPKKKNQPGSKSRSPKTPSPNNQIKLIPSASGERVQIRLENPAYEQPSNYGPPQ